MDSILTAVKQMLGLPEEYIPFDETVMMHINSTFLELHQLGVGPKDGFQIVGKEDLWEDFVIDPLLIGYLKTYMFMKVKLIFDPPTTSFLLDAIDRQINQIQWRMTAHVEPPLPVVEEVTDE